VPVYFYLLALGRIHSLSLPTNVVLSSALHCCKKGETRVRVKVEGSKVILTTDESDVSAFLKVMFDQGARIEIYSAHSHPDTEYGRGR
jgi:translation initiation factor 2B subunit (eIF-2B alpha/beta/delta family)